MGRKSRLISQPRVSPAHPVRGQESGPRAALRNAQLLDVINSLSVAVKDLSSECAYLKRLIDPHFGSGKFIPRRNFDAPVRSDSPPLTGVVDSVSECDARMWVAGAGKCGYLPKHMAEAFHRQRGGDIRPAPPDDTLDCNS